MFLGLATEQQEGDERQIGGGAHIRKEGSLGSTWEVVGGWAAPGSKLGEDSWCVCVWGGVFVGCT